VIFAAVMVGVLIGGIGSWLAQGKHRSARRRFRREATQLRYETERLRTHSAATTLPAPLPSSRSSGL
jgi:hypothetical protein